MDDYDAHDVNDYDDDDEKLYQASVLLFPPTPSPLSALEASALKSIMMMMKVALTMTEARINIITTNQCPTNTSNNNPLDFQTWHRSAWNWHASLPWYWDLGSQRR